VKEAKKTKRSKSDGVLLDAASKILSERNTIDISLSEIAQTSGLNSALISYHFGSKDGLLLALVRRDAEAALGQLEQLVAMDISPEQKVRLHIAGVINTYAKYPYLNRLIHFLLENTNTKLSQEVSDFFIKPLVAAQTRILEEGVAAGAFRALDPMCFYFTFIGACDIIFYGRQSLENAFQIRELTADIRTRYTDFVVDAALRLLRKD
jgi:TetR/AcrR family transcriptional regulator